MFSVGIVVPKEVETSTVITTVHALGWGTLYDSARTHDLQPYKHYIELHFKDATSDGMLMNGKLKEGKVILHGWEFSHISTLAEWKKMIEDKMSR